MTEMGRQVKEQTENTTENTRITIKMENEFERKLDLKLILSVIAAGLMSFTGVVVETSMNVTFPTLMKQFQINTATVQWITTGYLLVLSLIIPLSSFLKKRFPMKALFIVAISIFIGATVLCMLAPDFGCLLAGRLLQGVGTGIAIPLMFNIVLEQAPYNKMGFMMGIASLVTAEAPAVGPFLGGLIVNTLGWRMIFAFLLPVLLLSLGLGIYAIRQSSKTERRSFDSGAYLFLVLCFVCFIFAINQASHFGWISLPVSSLFILSLLACIGFVWRANRSETPLINIRVFQNRKFTFSVAYLVLIQFICLGISFVLPNYAQIVIGSDALTAGCILLPGCIIGAVLNPFTGKMLDKFGAVLPIGIGSIAAVAAAVLFATQLGGATSAKLTGIYIFFTIAQGFTVGNIMTNGLRNLPEERNADGNAVFSTLQQLAGAMGTSVVSTIIGAAQLQQESNRLQGTLEGSQQAFILLLVLTIGMVFCAACAVLPGEKKQPDNR